MKLFKHKELYFKFELNDELLFEVTGSGFASEILIGRSHECDWRIPSGDRCASSRHARIFKSGSKIILEDLGSRNGIFYLGQRIQRQQIKAGDIFSIGDCKLSVTLQEDAENKKLNSKKQKFHQLEQLNGSAKGTIYDLSVDVFKIGAAGDCNIVIPDSLVSQIHATLESHPDDTCWIKDMKSRNGTKVNQFPLSGGVSDAGRMLKDGDIISITYVDFRFLDKNIPHVRSQILLKLTAVLLTIAVVFGGYFAIKLIFPSSVDYYLAAERAAQAANFDKAEILLQKAADAHGSDRNMDKRQELMRSLIAWKDTLDTYNKIRALLARRQYVTAKKLFAEILSNSTDNWRWNSGDAIILMKQAKETQELVDHFLVGRDLLRNASEDFEYMSKVSQRLKKSIDICSQQNLQWRSAVMIRSREVHFELELVLREYKIIRDRLLTFNKIQQIPDVVSQLKARRSQAQKHMQSTRKSGRAVSAVIINYCDKLLESLRHLESSYNEFSINLRYVAALDFKRFKKELSLPQEEKCMIHPSFTGIRSQLFELNASLNKSITYLKNYKRRFTVLHLAPGQRSEILEQLWDNKILENALGCDSLDMRPPLYSDRKASGDFDRLLGINVFYNYLSSLDGDFDTGLLSERFTPVLFASHDSLTVLQSYLDFYYQERNRELHRIITLIRQIPYEKNLVEQYARNSDMLLRKRDQYVRRLYLRYRRETVERKKLILGGMICYLKTANHRFVPKDLDKELLKTLRSLHRKLAAYSERTERQDIALNEKKILETGLPGDPFVRQPWTDKFK